jgi:hypothetical protein
LNLDDVRWGRIPPGAFVRVRLGRRWPDISALLDLAAVTSDVRRLEIIGSDARAVADAVSVVRRKHAEYSRDGNTVGAAL